MWSKGAFCVGERILDFYESLADLYHLIFDDWDKVIERQASLLNPLLTAGAPGSSLKILDCACGIGTQALGLAGLGHQVVGSDLSPAAIRRARREAERLGRTVAFHVSDMTSLFEIEDRDFDVVAAFDNALPHLSGEQLGQAVAAMKDRLRPGGLFVASIRDYDRLLWERPAMQPPAFYGEEGERRIVHQVWDWTGNERYTLHLYITVQSGREWVTHHFVSEYRCLLRQELTDVLQANGLKEVQWLMPAESGFYQPLVLARCESLPNRNRPVYPV